MLKKLNFTAKLKEDREHVTTLLKRNRSKILTLNYQKDLSNIRLTLDHKKDLIFLRKILSHFDRTNFSLKEIYDYCQINSKIHKNINYYNRSSGQKLWSEAKKLIPPGSMLLSKNPDFFSTK